MNANQTNKINSIIKLISSAFIIEVNGGKMADSVDIELITGNPENKILTLGWSDNNDYEEKWNYCIFTESDILNATQTSDGGIVMNNQNGEPCELIIYEKVPIVIEW